MNSALLAILGILLYGNPLLILALWYTRLAGSVPTIKRWRSAMSWASLTLATIALVSFWVFGFAAHYPQPISNLVRLILFLCFFSTAGALVTALLGEGKLKWWIVLSSVLIPFNFLAWGAFG